MRHGAQHAEQGHALLIRYCGTAGSCWEPEGSLSWIFAKGINSLEQTCKVHHCP